MEEINSHQFYKDSQSERGVVCDLESFDSYAIDGHFVVLFNLKRRR